MINIRATNIKLTNAINRYTYNKISSIEKFTKDSEISGYIEVGKINNHHKRGEIFKAEINIFFNGNHFFTVSKKEDLYKAIDEAKEDIVRMITQKKDRKQTLFKRGAMSVKKMLKGISKRNIFTSRY